MEKKQQNLLKKMYIISLIGTFQKSKKVSTKEFDIYPLYF